MIRVAVRPRSNGSWAELGSSLLRWMVPLWPLLLGLALLVIPTLWRLATISWSNEQGAHGPIILVTGMWLIWRARPWEVARCQPFLPSGLVLLPLLILYCLGRITGVLPLEAIALYGILIAVLWLQAGPATLRRIWFPLTYLLFTITPPENWVFVATRPIKALISTGAVDLLSAFGLPIGNSGTVIQIDNYQLLVATACSGINSLIGISALGLFYVYLRHGNAPRYALLLVALMMPLAIAANFVRVIVLVLITYYVSEDAAQGVSHQLVGMGMFMLAMLMLLGLDTILRPLAVRWKASVT